MPLPPPAWWATLQPYRACQLCEHGADRDGTRVCTAPATGGQHLPKPVTLMRSTSGACGPEAEHMVMRGVATW